MSRDIFCAYGQDTDVVCAKLIYLNVLTDLSSSYPASSMSLAVGSAPTKTSSRHPMREHQHYLGTRYHPYQRPVSHNGSSTNHRETHSKQTTLSANDSCHYFQAKLDDPCVARPNDDTLEYAARMAAREAKAEECAGTSKFQDGAPEPYTLYSDFSIPPVTHQPYHPPPLSQPRVGH